MCNENVINTCDIGSSLHPLWSKLNAEVINFLIYFLVNLDIKKENLNLH